MIVCKIVHPQLCLITLIEHTLVHKVLQLNNQFAVWIIEAHSNVIQGNNINLA